MRRCYVSRPSQETKTTTLTPMASRSLHRSHLPSNFDMPSPMHTMRWIAVLGKDAQMWIKYRDSVTLVNLKCGS